MFTKEKLKKSNIKYLVFKESFNSHEDFVDHEHKHCSRNNNGGFEIGDMDME